MLVKMRAVIKWTGGPGSLRLLVFLYYKGKL
jgi:hypothetical protein